LTYEPTEVLRALFDTNSARNKWKIAAYVLKAYSEFFGPRAENLDIYYENNRAAFTCYTEKVVHKNGRFLGYFKPILI
jgi:cell cycle checkpoint control protein RAD9A